MKNLNAILLLISAIVLFSCSTDDEFDTSLEIEVISLEGEKVPDAEVRIYKSLIDSQEERSVVSTTYTDDEGISVVKGLKPDAFYQINVSKNSLTNWTEKTISPYIALGENKYETKIYENWFSNIASSGGKSWSAREIRIGNEFFTYLDCFSDNRHKFLKNGSFIYRANSPCSEFDYPSYTGTWLGVEGQITTYNPVEAPHYGLKILSTTPSEFVAEIRENELLIVKFFLTN